MNDGKTYQEISHFLKKEVLLLNENARFKTKETLIAPPHVQVLAAQLRASLEQAQAHSD